MHSKIGNDLHITECRSRLCSGALRNALDQSISSKYVSLLPYPWKKESASFGRRQLFVQKNLLIHKLHNIITKVMRQRTLIEES